jgi:hypothetical protein
MAFAPFQVHGGNGENVTFDHGLPAMGTPGCLRAFEKGAAARKEMKERLLLDRVDVEGAGIGIDQRVGCTSSSLFGVTDGWRQERNRLHGIGGPLPARARYDILGRQAV